MAGNEAVEDRLREFLHDPAWSIPAWPEPHTRVRAAARRQRRHVTGLAAMAGASGATAAIVTAAVIGVLPHAARSALSGPLIRNGVARVLPALGAAGFPIAIYPAASHRRGANLAAHCPNPAGLLAPQPSMRAQTIAVVASLGTSFGSDLRLSDRAYWPLALAQWKEGAPEPRARPTFNSSAPLEASPAALRRSVRIACGNSIARDSWLVIGGRGSAQTDYLVLDRAGHLLVWDAQTGA